MPKVILVAYGTQPVKQFDKENSDLYEIASGNLHASTFKYLSFINHSSEEGAEWVAEGRLPGQEKTPISWTASSWLLTRHGEAWNNPRPHATVFDAPVVFVGFNLKRFTGLMGIECSLPDKIMLGDDEASSQANNSIPLGMWRTPACIDIADMIYLDGSTAATKAVLTRRGLAEEFKDWEPHKKAQDDLALTHKLACQLNLYNQLK